MAASEFTGPDTGPNDGGGNYVVLSQNSKRPPTVEGPAEDTNLASFFTQDERESMGAKVHRRYIADVRSRSGRMRKCREFMELYAAISKTRSYPYQNIPSISLPILTYPMLQVQARLYDMLWPENGKVLYSAPAGVEDYARASATEKFANSYIRYKMPEMEQGLDDTLAQFCCFGSAFRRTYWDSHEGRVRSDWIPIEDFVAPDWYRCQDPSLRGVPRYTLVHHMTVADLEAHGDSGVFAYVNGLSTADRGEGSDQNSELRSLAKKVDGTDGAAVEDDDQDRPRMVLEHHCRWQMPKRPGKHVAFDGKWHWAVVTIDEPTKKVLRVVLREEDDPDDIGRFQREQAVFIQAQMREQAHQTMVTQATTVLTLARQQGREIPDLQMPEPPPRAIEPLPVRKREICFFTHYRAFWSEGFYGLGFGDFLAPLNKAGNMLLNQHVVGAVVRNGKPGFISRALRGARGGIEIQPGKLTEVDAPPEALDKGIKWMDPPLNDPTTMPLIKMVLELGEKLSGSADLMSGSTSGSNRTAKEIQILNAQLMKQISVLARRVKGAFKHELDKIWRCWGVFLPDEPEPTQVVDPATGQPAEIPISRRMFIPDARVMPAADPRMRFEKIEEANNKMGIVMNNPMLMQNPMALYVATQEVLQAQDGDRILATVQPPQPPQPPQPVEPFKEEAGWLRNEDHPVVPQDDDQAHMAQHSQFLSSPQAQMLTGQQRAMAEAHMRGHAAQDHEKRMTAMMNGSLASQLGPPLGQPMPPQNPGPPPGPPMMRPNA